MVTCSARWVGKVVLRWLAQGYTLHSLRHWFATTTYHEDNDLLAVQEALGHASPDTTRRYIKLQDDRVRALVHGVGAATGHRMTCPNQVTNPQIRSLALDV